MGVDLKWLVLDGYTPQRRSDWAYSHTMMEVGRDYYYYKLVEALPSEPVPRDFSSYLGRGDDGEPRYGQTTDDPYGNKLRMVKAGDLAAIEYTPKYPALAAAIAYVKALPSDRWIALYWH